MTPCKVFKYKRVTVDLDSESVHHFFEELIEIFTEMFSLLKK